MAKGSGLGQQLYVAGYDISGDVGSIGNCATPRGVQTVPGINATAQDRLLTLADGILDFNCYFNDAAGQAHAALSGLPTADVDAMYLTGTTAGDPTAMLRAKQVNYDWSRTADAGLIGSVSLQASAGSTLEWGVLVAPKQTVASAGNTTTYDGGGASAQGGMAQLQVFSIASGTPTFILQDNTVDNGAWATYISFGAVADGTEPTTVRGEETDNCNQYRRIALTGTFTNAVFAVAMRDGTAEDNVAYSG